MPGGGENAEDITSSSTIDQIPRASTGDSG